MRKYQDKWANWGIVTGLQSLLMLQYETYTAADILKIARMFQVETELLHRMSYVPATVEEIPESHPNG